MKYMNERNHWYSYLFVQGDTGSQALKRAKIIDSDNEDEVQGAEGGDSEQRPPLIDEGGESSDEGVRNDGDQGYVKQHLRFSSK